MISCNSKDNANTFGRFFSNLADLLLEKLPRPKNKFGVKTTEEYCYQQIQNECEDFFFFLHNAKVSTVDEILKNLDVPKATGIDKIFGKFLKDNAPVIVIHLANIINLSKCKIEKIKSLFKKGVKTEAKNYRHISLLHLILKVTEKPIHDQTQDYL